MEVYVMNNSNNRKDGQPKDLKQIPLWTRRYAQNRTISFLVFLVIFLLFFITLAGTSYLAGNALRSRNMLAFWSWVFVLVCVSTALIFFSVPGWGGNFINRITQRLYSSEGDITLSTPVRIRKHSWIGWVAGSIFMSCILTSVALGIYGYIPIEYMQPISAIYCVPFLVFLWFWQRPMVGLLSLLWPSLYALHAIMVVVGVPIQFSGEWSFLNMLIPIVGYGILSGLIGHLYSRFALSKLKDLASVKQVNE
jgi:hypothetical protein